MLASLVAAATALWALLSTATGLRVVTALDLAVLRAIERVRTDAGLDVARAVMALGEPPVFRALAWSTLLVLVAARRFQHLVVLLLLLLIVPVAATAGAAGLGRMRPAGVEVAGAWEGYAHPAVPVASFGLVVTAAVLLLVPKGRWRRRAATVAATSVACLVLARLYAGVDHPTDAAGALAVGVAGPVAALRLAAPERIFPVTYRRGVRAHLDIGGRRGEAIRTALARQLGVDVVDVRPVGLAGSAGSTPLRLRLADGSTLFGKLYASTHLWSDRWYKLARTVRYGRLEDERPFNTVRRLVQYEDHMLRLLRDAGVPTAPPLGVVEITPEREYLLVTGFLDGAEDIGHAPLSPAAVDNALAAVRRLWDAGLAHRDIKPANVLVRGDEVWLVDAAFAEVRPTPWRQAVDLANMLLTLGLRLPPEDVYAAAVHRFTPEEVGEAFAATRSVTVPAQLRSLLRAHGPDVADRFRALAPPTPPVSIQRWSLRRIALTVGVLLLALAGTGLVAENLRVAGLW